MCPCILCGRASCVVLNTVTDSRILLYYFVWCCKLPSETFTLGRTYPDFVKLLRER